MINGIIGFCLCVSLGGFFYAGYLCGRDKRKTVAITETNKEEIEKARLRDEGFNNIMNYDVNVALGKRD